MPDVVVPGEGPKTARVVFCGEAPGKHELKEKRAFVGPSGGILWPLVWRECRLAREDVYVTNLLKIEMGEKWSKAGVPPEILREYGDLLDAELAELPNLDIIVPVGRYAARHFLGEWASMQVINGRVYAQSQCRRCARWVARQSREMDSVHRDVLVVDGSAIERLRAGLLSREQAGRELVGASVDLHSSGRPDSTEIADRPSVPHPPLCQSCASGAGDASGQPSALGLVSIHDEAALQVGASIHGREHVLRPAGAPTVSDMSSRSSSSSQSRLIVGIIHPAAAMRDASQLAWTQKGLETLGRVLRGEKVEPVPTAPPVQTTYAEHAINLRSVIRYDADMVALDTEWLPDGRVWGLSAATDRDRAAVVPAGAAEALDDLRWWLNERRPAVILHYALADLDPLRRMGIDIRAMGLEIIDTNILAFHQQTEPQGLKALARRWLGLEMRDYEDVVGPYHTAALKTYFESVKAATEPPMLERRGKPTKKEPEGKLLQPKPAPASRLHKLVRGALRDFAKSTATDLAKRWEGWDADVRAEAEGLVTQAPRASLELVPLAEAVQYAGTDAAATIGILPFLRNLPQSPQVEVIDHGVIAQTDDMQQHGLLLDEPRRQKMAAYLTSELEEMREVLRIVVGDPEFNPDSRDDVAKVLFGVVKDEGAIRQLSQADNDGEAYVLPVAYTKTRLPATDKKSLALLSKDHVLPPLLLHYRQLQKIDSTYVRPLPRFVRGGILHPRYSLTRVPSGRLAARDPNLMAFPKRSELGKKVRDLFPARPGRLFGSWDHKGIELRVMADEAGDAAMLEELQEDYPLDMHRSNAARFFGLRYEDVDPEGVVRDGSKILTFGIAYGAEPERLHFEALVIGFDQYSVDDFARFRADWFRKYAGVAQRTRDVAAFTRQNGYILDRWGRRRYIPSVWLTGKRWPFAKLREEGERQAFNHTIQGGAQGLMKRAQIRANEQAFPVIRDCGYGVDPVLQIHDNLVVEFDEGGWDVVDAAIRWAMVADSNLLRCPILTTSKKGARWSEI